MRKKATFFYVTFITLFIYRGVIAQEKKQLELNLDGVLKIAEQKSLEAFRARNKYLTKYFDYKNFEAQKLPTISLNLNPLNYVRSVTQRYNFIDNRDEFREAKTLNSSLGINFSQKLMVTGGTLFLNSNLNRLENIGDSRFINFNNNIVRFGFTQPLFTYNKYKWEKKTAPLIFEKAEKEFIESLQTTNIKATEIFFSLASTQLYYEISLNNYENAKMLYEHGEKKYDLSIIDQKELLSLELNVINTEVALDESLVNLLNKKNEMCLFLKIDKGIKITPIIDEYIPQLKMPLNFALEQARSNNPEMLNLKLKEIQSLSKINKAKFEANIKPEISGSYGLNKSAENYVDSYSEPLAQHQFNIQLSLPIIDWGRRKRNLRVASDNHELILAENKQSEQMFLQLVKTHTNNFNNQKRLIEMALRANNIAIKSHELVIRKYISGTISILELHAAILDKDQARIKYLDSLKKYWINYYMLQKLTLVDISTKEKIDYKFNIESIESNGYKWNSNE